MDARPPIWAVVRIAMILALLLTAVMPGLPVGSARATAQDAGESPVPPVAPAPVAVGPAAPESELTLNPAADATISVVNPDVNFGGDALLGTAMGYQTMSQPAAKGGAGAHLQAPESPAWEPAQRALLRFDLGLPAGVVIDTAQLSVKLSVSGGADSVVLRAYQVTSDWLEARVTWNNKPTWGSLYAQTTVGAGISWYAWDVTEIARAWLQGSNYGLLLEPTTPTDAPWSRAFSSREAGAEPPQLVVTYHLPGPTLFAPPTGRPGAELPVAGQNYPPGAAITLQLASGGTSWTCGSASADAGGILRTICTVPLAAPIGAATLNARAVTGNLLASSAVQIVAGPALQLTPASGPPGTVVQYAVTNLVAGSLRLDYAGVPLVGPRPVAAGAASGSFVVPADRPSPLGSATVVKAVNLAGGVTAGATEAAFQSQKAAAAPSFQFTSASASGGTHIPGEVFDVTGKIDLPAGSAVQGYQVLAMWQDGAGHSVPIHLEPGTVAADGGFLVRARAPSLRMGDAWSNVGLLEGLFVVMVKPGYEESADFKTGYTGPFALELPVHVTSSTGGAIEDAVVRILDYPGYDKPTQNATTQLQEWTIGQVGDSDLQAYICSKPWQKTTKAGNALVELPALEGLAINPDYKNWNPALSVEKPALLATAGSVAAPRGAQPAAPALPPPKHPPTGPQWKHLTITVNALLSGFGLKGADGKWYGYHTDVYFNTQTGQIVDAWSQSLGAQLEVVLDPIPGGEIPFEFSPVELTAGIQEPGSDPTVYGKFLSFTGVTGAGVTLPQDLANLRFAIPWKLNDYVAKVRVELAGQVLLEADPLKYPTPGMCSTTEPLVGEWGLYDLTLPYPTTLAAGLHELKVIVKLKTGAEVTRALKLRFVDAPAWFRTSAASQRWAGWDEVNEAGK